MHAGQIVWTSAMGVGIPEIDEQHKKLIDLINSVEQAMKLGQGREMLGNWLRALANYALFHFQAEEAYMQQVSYPQVEEHTGGPHRQYRFS